MLRAERHNFNEGRLVTFVVIKFDCLPCNKCEPRANGVFILGDESITHLLKVRIVEVHGIFGIHVIRVPLLEMNENMVIEIPH